MELKIESLSIGLDNIAGQEHRVGPIVERAVALFAERAAQVQEADTRRSASVDSVDAQPVNMNLGKTSTEDAAGAIADAWLQALMRELRR